MRNSLIYIDGTVGAGKTTLINILSDRGMSVAVEPFLENPVLDKFYGDKSRYSFASQVYFLNKKFELIHSLEDQADTIVDRSIYGDFIFAKMLHDAGDMSEEEFQIYTELFNNIVKIIPTPKLIVYLDISLQEALRRVAKRGRAAEQTVDIQYWEDLNRNYKETFYTYNRSPILTIHVDEIDFQHNQEDQKYVWNLLFDKLSILDPSVTLTHFASV